MRYGAELLRHIGEDDKADDLEVQASKLEQQYVLDSVQEMFGNSYQVALERPTGYAAAVCISSTGPVVCLAGDAIPEGQEVVVYVFRPNEAPRKISASRPRVKNVITVREG